jgi:hypothetical protein
MIASIIDLLRTQDFYGVSKEVDIAKGKYKLPDTWKGLKNTLRRL